MSCFPPCRLELLFELKHMRPISMCCYTLLRMSACLEQSVELKHMKNKLLAGVHRMKWLLRNANNYTVLTNQHVPVLLG